MSRAKVHEVSSPISLFPFIGILLCTMGALLVILVAVSRSARDYGREASCKPRQPAAATHDERGPTKELEEAQHSTLASSSRCESEAQRKLREEQLRLSHMEDHIRRLQEQLRSLQLAAVELAGARRRTLRRPQAGRARSPATARSSSPSRKKRSRR